jgi:branched-chain amino acid transport system ATP-binding protein
MTLLKLEGVSRSFGGVRAVHGVSTSVEAGELFGVIGPNGAGKTTLFNLITGLIRPDEGAVTLNGVDITRKSPEQIATLGIARTYQTIRLFDTMTVRENVMVGGHIGLAYSLFDLLFWRRSYRDGEGGLGERVDALLETVGLSKRAGDAASTLSYGEQRRLELARALAARPSVLMLDEPAAGMNTREAIDLAALLRRLVAGGGLTVILIEHNVRMIMNLCDRIAVMNFGQKLAEGVPSVVRNDTAVVEAYLGKSA